MRAALLVVLFLVCPARAASADTTVSFDDLPVGTPVTNQYANAGGQNQGVVFGPLPGNAGAAQAPPVVASAPGQAVSGSQVARIDCPDSSGRPGGMCNEGLGYIPDATGTFQVPRVQVSVYAGIVGGTASSATVTLTAYDSGGHVVGTPSSAQVQQGQPFAKLTVTAPSAQIVGFQIQAGAGDSNKEVAIDNLSFNVPSSPPPPDFTLTPQSTNFNLTHGQSADDPITIGRLSGSTGDIQFSASGLPHGVSAQLAPNPATSQTTLTLSVDAAVPPTPDTTITITGTPTSASAGGAAHSFTIALHISSACDNVLTGQDLIDALGARCSVIHINDVARIDVSQLDGNPFSTGSAVLNIPEGTTLESDRSFTQLGGVLYMSQSIGKNMLEIAGSGAPTRRHERFRMSRLRPHISPLPFALLTRITGLRLFAYDPGDTTARGDNTSAISVHDIQHSVLVDNNEMAGWPEATVAVGPANNTPSTAGRIHVSNNFIHNNVQCNGGYGVSVGGTGYALIDHNVFNDDRHDATVGYGSPGAGYIARFNFVLTKGPKCGGSYNQHFDVHGSKIPHTWIGGPAGGFTQVSDNAIRGDQVYGSIHELTRPAFTIRGIPQIRAVFTGNVLEHQDLTAALRLLLHYHTIDGHENILEENHKQGDWYDYLVSHNELTVRDNHFGQNTSQQLAAGDFNGDGVADVFVATGRGWFFSPSGRREWFFLRDSTSRLNQLAFGDFNGDHRTDVFTQQGDRWLVSYGGTSGFQLLPAGSNIPMKDYRFYDFDGDGKTDIFRTNGKQWYYSRGGATPWMPLASSSKKIDELRFCDFNGDGKTDVFSLANGQWSVSYGGTTSWQRLNKRLSSDLSELRFGDFDGDGRCDIVRAHGRGFQISYGGTSPWQQMYTRYQRQASFDGTLLGNFEGGKRIDVLEYAIVGQALDRFELMSDFGPFNDWSTRDIL